MDWLRFGRPLARAAGPKRFNAIDWLGDTARPQLIGVLPSESDFRLGCPSLERSENVELILSNRLGESSRSVLIELKWRPSGHLATLAAKLTLHDADGQVYSYSNIETYKPAAGGAHLRQYGSSGSPLKVTVESPYRLIRVFFRGYMKIQNQEEDQEEEEKLVKLSVCSSPTSLVYDFAHDFNAAAFKQSYQANQVSLSVGAAARELLFCDQHEQLVRFCGELIVGGDRQQPDQLTLFGFYCKTTLINSDKATTHLRGALKNGQAFHLLQRTADNNKLELGYVCFKMGPLVEPVERVPGADWDQIGAPGCNQFELRVAGSGLELECQARRRNGDFFDIQLGGVAGWATVSRVGGGGHLATELAASLADYKRRQELALVYEPKLFCELEPQSDLRPQVVGLADFWCLCADLVGAKAASLAELTRFAKLPAESGRFEVAGGVVLTRFAYDAFVQFNSPLLGAQIARLDQLLGSAAASEQDIRAECEQLVASFAQQAELPPATSECLEQILSTSGLLADDDNLLFAVRSSSWGEDGDDMSAAGQLTTELEVPPSLLADKIRLCFGSKFSYENVQYKRAHGLSPSLPMAVIIQQMVSCQQAGVAFTSDLIDPRQTIITANYGLGESVVSGRAEPDTIRVSYDSDSLDARPTIASIDIGSKQVILGTTTGDDDQDPSKCCLSEGQILQLARACRSVAHLLFGAPRDIEWGFERGRRLFLFQSRPITSLELPTQTELLHEDDRMRGAELEFATRANVGEVAPFARSPLSSSFFTRYWFVYMNKTSIQLGASPATLHPDMPLTLMWCSYYLYFGLRRSSFFPPVAPGEQKPVTLRSMEISLFGHEISDYSQISEASRNIPEPEKLLEGLRFDIKTLPLRLAAARIILKVKALLQVERQKFKKLFENTNSNTATDIYATLMKLMNLGHACWDNHMRTSILNDRANFQLLEYLAKFIDDPKQLSAASNKFLAAPEVLTGEIPRQIERIAKLIKLAGQQAVDEFLAKPSDQALEYINNNNINSQVSAAFGEFIDKFGHRSYNEFELQQKSWRQDQLAIVDMLKLNCKPQAATNSSNNNNNNKVKRPANNDQIIDSLNCLDNINLLQRFRLRQLASRCQTLTVARELSKDTLIDFCDLIRLLVCELAKALRQTLRLPDEDLIYYLLFKDIEPLIDSPRPDIVSRAMLRRSVHKKVLSKLWLFDEIISGHDLKPINAGQDRHLEAAARGAARLAGNPASAGSAEGGVCVVGGIHELGKVKSGDILVTHSTDIGFSPVFPIIAGLVTEMGGMISHGAVVAREYGLPCLLGVANATQILQDGERVLLDADRGQLLRLDKQQVQT